MEKKARVKGWKPQNLTLKTLQLALCEAFFGDTTKEHLTLVVPRQGNIMNPSQMVKCSAYFTYYIQTQKRRILDRTFDNEHVATVINDIALQCIGINAEEYMQATLFWDERSDIRRIFAKYDTQLINSARQIDAVPYFQDGANSVLSYNTTLRTVTSIVLAEEVTDDSFWKKLILRGKVYNPIGDYNE